MLSLITNLIQEVLKEADGILGIAILHINGLPIVEMGYNKEFWVKTSALLQAIQETSNFLKSKPRGFDIILENYYIVARTGERIIAMLIATPSVDMEHLDYLAFRLVEEVEKNLFGL